MIEPGYICSEEFWQEREVFVAGKWEGDAPEVPDRSVLFQTSGSTGKAKWLVLGKDALMLSARAVNAWLEVGSESNWGLVLPLNHVGGFGVVARASSSGCGLAVFKGKWNTRNFTKWVESEGVTHVSLVPTQVYDLVRDKAVAPRCLRAVVVGGGMLGNGLGQAARDAGWPVLASFGMTETCSQVATQELKLLGSQYVESPLKILPIWNVRRSEEELLEVEGDALFSGSLEPRGGLWQFEKRKSGWFTTNDRVAIEGDILTPEGRADSVVKIMGELVDVEAVERRFLKMAGDRIEPVGFAVAAVEDARRGHVLVAIFEKNLERATVCFDEYQSTAPGVERFVRSMLVDRLPRTSLGKLRRGELAEMCQFGDS